MWENGQRCLLRGLAQTHRMNTIQSIFLALTFLQVLVFGQAVGSREMTLDAFPADVT